jgi:hypothetical protein
MIFAGVHSEKSIPTNIDASISKLICKMDGTQSDFHELDKGREYQSRKKCESGQNHPAMKAQPQYV